MKSLTPMTDKEIEFQLKLIDMVDGDCVAEWEEEYLYTEGYEREDL